ncbi:MAG: hypothetical protein DRN04_01850 [Thermoprotei archaeon]|nr:MAG: hypothetical protein DRN04_01850 [Thermoprotei archaeon]
MSKRAIILGLDAASPKLIKLFAEKGVCPNFKKLLERGSFSKALPAIPAQTPENWTTIATGAWPGTHGIAVWGRHDPGEPVTEKYGREAMSSYLCKAEYLWEAASRQGLTSILFNFIGYPTTCPNVIYVDWFYTPIAYYFELASAAVYTNYPPEPPLELPGTRAPRYLMPIELTRAKDWKHLPESSPEPLEAELEILLNWPGEPVRYYLLVLGEKGKYDRCVVSRSKDYKDKLFELKPGEWSPWIKEKFVLDDGEKVGTIRFKLVELSEDASRVRLYRSQVYPVRGFTYPPELAEELVEKFGPYINEVATHVFFSGLIDEKTWVEEIEYQINWIVNASKYLIEKYNASLYFLHWHLLDTLQHQVLGLADPYGGKYDPAKAEEAWRLLETGYRLADKLVGGFLDLLDDRTYIVVVSDHGNSPNRKKYSILKALAEKGLVYLKKENGKLVPDWSKSKVFVDLTNVYVNLKSRYRDGVVEDEEYEEVRRKVIEALRECRDQDGEYAVALVLKREDAPLVGLWGPHVGDVVFVYSQGFTWGADSVWDGSITVGGANHGPQIPTAETEYSSNYGVLIIAGPGVKEGYERPVDFLGPAQLVDVAPTVSYLLGILPPRHTQGRILYDFLEGWDISEVKREKRIRKFPLVRLVLKGDVTDQVK